MLSNREKLYWFIQIIGWSAYGIASILLYTLVQDDLADSLYLGEIFQIAFYIFSTHLLRLLIKRGNWINSAWSWLALKVFVSIVLLSVSNYLFLLSISFLLGTISNQDFQPLNAFISIVAPFIMYFLWSLIYLTFHYFQWYNKSLKYEAAINEIELNYLKSQLNPHFIFNALNSIRALVDENPAKSKDAITHLSIILRNSLLVDKKKLVPFEEELSTVRDYLALETIRFEERLSTKFNIHPESYRFQIPPMMIQTLVENAIKHGISKLTKGGEIELKTNVNGRYLSIDIFNSGYFDENKSKDSKEVGYGLKNTKKRLELLYGDTAKFSIQNVGSNTVLTEIVIPDQAIMSKTLAES